MRRIQLHGLISGDLAGTSFRSMIRRQAEKLKLVGWVLQHEDGRLEVVANGEERNVRVFFGWCERGPLASAVTSVVTTAQPREAFFGFSVRQPPPQAPQASTALENPDAPDTPDTPDTPESAET